LLSWWSPEAADRYQAVKSAAVLVVAETKTWVLEEFGETMENDSRLASRMARQTTRWLRKGKQGPSQVVLDLGGELLTQTEDIVKWWKDFTLRISSIRLACPPLRLRLRLKLKLRSDLLSCIGKSSAINPSRLAPVEHTHGDRCHTSRWTAIHSSPYTVNGMGVQCLALGHLDRGKEVDCHPSVHQSLSGESGNQTTSFWLLDNQHLGAGVTHTGR